jgi:protein gp37
VELNMNALWPTKEIRSIIRGCSPVDRGCLHCYGAVHEAYAKGGEQIVMIRDGIPTFNGRVIVDESASFPWETEDEPNVWWFSHTDPFHPDVPTDLIVRILDSFSAHRHHRLMIVTKRPERLKDVQVWQTVKAASDVVSIGISASDQDDVIDRWDLIRGLLPCPRFVYVEPCIRYLRLPFCETSALRPDWVSVLCEQGPPGRVAPAPVDAIRRMKEDCDAAGIPFWWERGRDGPEAAAERKRAMLAGNPYLIKPERMVMAC